ncbi:hypothetical protein [Gordonibacter massiliensis (ex Traore et al. 2017)]|uniref:hypothetical protein n=1 Tax=Gordonibacter massiliensis (ex Traore et al. 2017) TaxID=1841863 RepID=UPI001C8B1BB7|nr:hypothetical protein [Gordonibacter massiliensis (ex Traore et al. 2017)]MBX9032659.1 hypothetical protein [Gordonibacter massiliensis (ex Traore et al. 2017)]
MAEYVVDSDETRVPKAWFLSNGCAKLVRCRDCAMLGDGAVDERGGPYLWCKRTLWRTEPGGYCAWAERREDA